jgi:chorismate synthase
MSNSLGKLFVITSFGESHGRCIGVVVDGCPAGLALDVSDVQRAVDRRRPSPGAGATARIEADRVEVLSGVFGGHTTGAPLAMLVWNRDTDSASYEKMRFTPRPGHADYTAFVKYGGFNDFRGGGRFSGRITAGLVMAGAVAAKLLATAGIEILAHTVDIGGIKARAAGMDDIRQNVDISPLRCADAEAAGAMARAIEKAHADGDSLGGIVEGLALNVPPGLGEPVFDTLEGDLAKALFAIPAVKGVEFGAGFDVSASRGSMNNDPFAMAGGRVVTTGNRAGGILGGISDGMPVVVRAAFKPTPSVSRPQQTVDLRHMVGAELSVAGRHDTCIVPRAVPVVSSMIAVTLADFALRAGIIPRVIG